MMNNYDKLPYWEVIYEFKYEFPKKFGNRLYRVCSAIFVILLLLFFPLFFYIFNSDFTLDTLYQIEIAFTQYYNINFSIVSQMLLRLLILLVIYGFGFMFMAFYINVLFIAPRSYIVLTNKGMFMKASRPFLLWRTSKFYHYGSFGFRAKTGGHGITIWSIDIFDIDKEYRLFDFRHSSMYVIVTNKEIQDMDKMLAILRERSAEALESQGKAEQYDLCDKIRYL